METKEKPVEKEGQEIKKTDYRYVLSKTDLAHNSCQFFCCEIKKDYTVATISGELDKELTQKDYKNDSLAKALVVFESLYANKTGNKYPTDKFQKKKYFHHDVDFDDKTDDKQETVEISPESKLDEKMQQFMKTIINPREEKDKKKTKVEEVKNLGKTPWGFIAISQLKIGLKCLVTMKEAHSSRSKGLEKLWKELSLEFFTYVPVSKPFIINTEEQIDHLAKLIETLINQKETMEMIQNTKLHQYDAVYAGLGINLEIVQEDQFEYNIIKKYLQVTNDFYDDIRAKKIQNPYHYFTPSSYEMVQLIKINGDKPSIDGSMLLMHGTPNRNVIGILKRGLKIFPGANVHITGRLFGDGLYFADTFVKSVNYTEPWFHSWRDREQDLICLFLVEVPIAGMARYLKCPSTAGRGFKAPPGCKNTGVIGVGRYTPNFKKIKKIDNVMVPVGEIGPSSAPDAYLNYNEYVVYDESLVKLKYVVTLKATGTNYLH